MTELILAIILIISLLGVLIIIFRKIPVLAELPDIREGRVKDGLLSRITNRIKNSPHIQSFSFEVFLQKILSKIRILTLKTERKISSLLQKMRENAQKKNGQGVNYWREINSSNKKEEKQ